MTFSNQQKAYYLQLIQCLLTIFNIRHEVRINKCECCWKNKMLTEKEFTRARRDLESLLYKLETKQKQIMNEEKNNWWKNTFPIIKIKTILSLLILKINDKLGLLSKEKQKILNIINSRPKIFYELYEREGNHSMIYLIFSLHTNHKYIGQTGRDIKRRYKEEVNIAKKFTFKKSHMDKRIKNNKLAKNMYYIGIEKFIVLPIINLGKANKTARIEIENSVIKKYNPDLNCIGKKRTIHKRSRHSKGRLEVLKRKIGEIRNKYNNKNEIKNVEKQKMLFTKYKSENNVYYNIEGLINNVMKKERLRKNEQKQIKITIEVGSIDISNWKEINKKWGESLFKIKSKPKAYKFKNMRKAYNKIMKNGNTYLANIQIKENTNQVKIDKIVNNIANKKHIEKRFINNCSNAQLLNIYFKIKNTLHGIKRSKSIDAIKKYMQKRIVISREWGKIINGIQLKMKFYQNDQRYIIKKWIKKVIEYSSLSQITKQYLKESISIMTLKQPTIKDYLINNKKYARQKKTEEKCSQLCKDNIHYQQKMINTSNTLQYIGEINANSSIFPNKGNFQYEFTEQIQKCLETITCFWSINHQYESKQGEEEKNPVKKWLQNIGCSLTNTGKLIEDLHNVKLGIQKSIESENKKRNERHGIDINQIKLAKRFIQKYKLVVSRLDKNSGQLFIECKHKANERLNNTFIQCNNFQRVWKTKNQIIHDMHEDYIKLGLQQIQPWDTKGDLAYAYCDPKNKDINKSRGIVAMWNHPAKRLLKMASKTFMWLIMNTNTQIGFTLRKLTDLKSNIGQINGQIRDLNKQEQWKTEVLQFDIDQMYTNLNKDNIRDAVIWFIDLLKEKRTNRLYGNGDIAIKRKGKNTYNIHRGKADEGETQLDYNKLMNIVIFDLNNMFFTIQGSCYFQQKGVPIGGFLGAFYAIIQCSKAESGFINNWKYNNTMVNALRYIDDEIIWIFYKNCDQGKNEKQEIKDKIYEEVYGNELKIKDVEIKNIQDKNIAIFIGAQIITDKTNSQIYVKPYIKNEDEIEQHGKQKFIMYKGKASFTGKSNTYGTIVAVLCRMQNNCTNEKHLYYYLQKQIQEFDLIGMDRKIIKKAIENMIMKNSGNTKWRNTWMKGMHIIKKKIL